MFWKFDLRAERAENCRFVIERDVSSTRNRMGKRAPIAFCLCVACAFPMAAAVRAEEAAITLKPTTTASASATTSAPATTSTSATTVAAPDANANDAKTSLAVSGSAVALPVAGSTSSAAFNVLILPLDNLTAAQTGAASLNGAVPNTGSSEAARVVGPAEAAAAPLRRALLKRGWSDVLSANADSSVLRRAGAEGRLSQTVLDQLRQAMTSVVTSIASDANDATTAQTPATYDVTASPTSSAPTVAAPGVVAPTAASPLTPTIGVSAQVKPFEDATQSAIAAASRLGQALNYRAVLLLTLAPDKNGKMSYIMLLTDALRETGELSAFDVPREEPRQASSTGSAGALTVTRRVSYQTSAEIGSALLQQKLTNWAQVPGGDRAQITLDSLAAARAAIAQGQLVAARDALTRVLAFDATQRDALLLMGDVQTRGGDLDAAIMTYRRALGGDGDKGAVWTQIASTYAALRKWPDTMEAGRQALAANGDSLALRLAMATAQLGRAQLFTDAGQFDGASVALGDADVHLKKARALAPDDPAVLRLLAQQMTQSNNARGALQMLDLAAPQLFGDRDFQVLYATALVGRSGRESDAFAAWMRAVKLSDATSSTRSQLPAVDRARFRRLVEGYDQTVSKMVTRAYTLTNGIVQGNVSRERASSSIKPLLDDIALANQILKSLLPPDDRARTDYLARLEIGDTFSQALTSYQMYAETADDTLRDKAIELHKDAMTRLNALRAG